MIDVNVTDAARKRGCFPLERRARPMVHDPIQHTDAGTTLVQYNYTRLPYLYRYIYI